MARKNPTINKAAPNDEVVEGMDRLPIASGINTKALEQANEMPDVSMKTNDGDNPSISDAPFANGRDQRVFEGGPRNNPTPSMPGA